MAAILFTSGSTGPPKGVITPYRVFAAQVRLLREAFGIEPGERDLSTFPLFALFGPALGMASIVPAMDASRPARADPERLLEAIRDFRCTNMFASPALIDRLGRFCAARGVGLPTLRRAISAGAPASMAALERFAAALPDSAEVLTPYGATEALPVSVIGTAEILGDTRPHTQRGAGVCVGRPVPSAEVRIVPIRDDAMPDFSETAALPCGQIGEIAVAGPMVTPGYYGRPEATALAKMHDTQGRLWHRMGDVGYLDEKGRLWMCGRKSHRVETATETLFSVPCEAVFDAHPAVFRSALVGVRRGDATIPVLCVEREPGQPRSKAVLSAELLELARRHGHTRQIERVLYSRRFPVDVRHNAKIFREKLAVWAQGRIG
jgi:acyl-CoA synthetase (AMP-forming)/AMP-acid ligase II